MSLFNALVPNTAAILQKTLKGGVQQVFKSDTPDCTLSESTYED